MTAEFSTTELSSDPAGTTTDEIGDDALLRGRRPVRTPAREHIAGRSPTRHRRAAPRQVGLELEYHLVELARPGRRRPTWAEVLAAVAVAATDAVRKQRHRRAGRSGRALHATRRWGSWRRWPRCRPIVLVLQTGLRATGYGAAPLGSDPARPTRRINPNQRYVAMERHFEALGCAAPGRAMMTATAALQVNLDAGPAGPDGANGCSRIRDLGPVLVAVSACSPLLAGEVERVALHAPAGLARHRSTPAPRPLPDGEPTAGLGRATRSTPR